VAKVVFGGLAVVVACAALAVTEDAAGVGTVLASWGHAAGANARACCYTMNGFVVVNTYYNPQYVYTPKGSLVSSFNISLGTGWRDSSPCHLGAGYFAIINANAPYTVAFVSTAGSVAGSFTTASMTYYPMNLAYDADGGYYYANGYAEPSFVRRYTTTGSFAGYVTVPTGQTYIGALGWTRNVNNVAGSYIFDSNFGMPTNRVWNLKTGLLVETWTGPGDHGCGGDCGLASANQVWVAWEVRSPLLYVFEESLGNTNVRVTPASLGSIKALYR
jgi:hypothetical protein